MADRDRRKSAFHFTARAHQRRAERNTTTELEEYEVEPHARDDRLRTELSADASADPSADLGAELGAQPGERRANDAASERAEREERAAERRREADGKRAVHTALRDMDRRDAQRKRDELRDSKQREREAIAEQRAARLAHAAEMRARAKHRSDEVGYVIAAFDRLLGTRERGLESLRASVADAHARDGAAGLAASVTAHLAGRDYFRNARDPVQVRYQPERRQLALLVDLPDLRTVPRQKSFHYVAARDEILPDPRRPAELEAIYRALLARFVLCVLDYVFAIAPPELVAEVALNGYVRARDRGTGAPGRPCLVTVLSGRADFAALTLDEPELDPVRCLHDQLSALLTPHPYDLEEVTPFVRHDTERFRILAGAGALAGVDVRTDLLALSPHDFERLVKSLAEAMGLTAWRTQSSRDEGVDAVAVNEALLTGGPCVIQARRYRDVVPVDAVRALAGTMDEKKASTGIAITTSWFGPSSHTFAAGAGRIQLIDGRNLRTLIKQYLGVEIPLGLPRTPAEWRARPPS